ncbi:hypothetical protein BDR26DRAFT_865783 [Obelidium mucronatum]|nr:hypothetical protein BDR26DRAFT_865783 [Obelidium mucronatum]
MTIRVIPLFKILLLSTILLSIVNAQCDRYPQDCKWQTCNNADTFSLSTAPPYNSLPPIAMGYNQPSMVLLNGWYSVTVTKGALVYISTTVCPLGNAQWCIGGQSQTQVFDFCSLSGVSCPVNSNWFTQDLRMILPGIVPQANVWGQVTVRIVNADRTTPVLCFSNNNYFFHR